MVVFWGGGIKTTLKQFKVQNIGILEEMDSFLTENALLEKGPKHSGMVRPPLIRAMPERKQICSLNVIPYL